MDKLSCLAELLLNENVYILNDYTISPQTVQQDEGGHFKS